MGITEANKIYPVKLLIHLVDDDELIRELITELLTLHGMPKLVELANPWDDPDEYNSHLADPEAPMPNICVFDYLFKDEHGRNKLLTGLDLTRNIMRMAEDLDEAIKPKVIMISGFDNDKVSKEFTNSDGFRWIDKGHDMDLFKKDLMDAINTAVIRTKRYYERLAKKMERDKLIDALLLENEQEEKLPRESEAAAPGEKNQ